MHPVSLSTTFSLISRPRLPPSQRLDIIALSTHALWLARRRHRHILVGAFPAKDFAAVPAVVFSVGEEGEGLPASSAIGCGTVVLPLPRRDLDRLWGVMMNAYVSISNRPV